MIVPNKMLRSWKKIKQRNDYKAISDSTSGRFTPNAIKQTIHRGSGNEFIIASIERFYKPIRKPRLKELQEVKKLINSF